MAPLETHAAPEPAGARVAGLYLLVMDDEPAVREVLVEMLRRTGHRADACVNGEEALAAWRRGRDEGHPYDGLILDLSIPDGMGAAELLARLRESDPTVRALVCSGYPAERILSRHRNPGFVGVLSKPFGPADLAEAVARLRPPGG